jgi:dolichyl-diphosphooligosaccharide--protein glycosyltransferase
MQVPLVGFQPIKTSEHMGALGVFGLLQIVAFALFLRSHLSAQEFRRLVVVSFVSIGSIGMLAFVILVRHGLIAPWTGRFLSLLHAGNAKKYTDFLL